MAEINLATNLNCEEQDMENEYSLTLKEWIHKIKNSSTAIFSFPCPSLPGRKSREIGIFVWRMPLFLEDFLLEGCGQMPKQSQG